MENIREILGQAANVAIIGHVRPDGDCVGSCLGLRNYLKLIAPQLEVQVYLEDGTIVKYDSVEKYLNRNKDFHKLEPIDECPFK